MEEGLEYSMAKTAGFSNYVSPLYIKLLVASREKTDHFKGGS